MGPLAIVERQVLVEIGLQLRDALVERLPEGTAKNSSLTVRWKRSQKPLLSGEPDSMHRRCSWLTAR
jgi:hypothetical protein